MVNVVGDALSVFYQFVLLNTHPTLIHKNMILKVTRASWD